MGGVSAIYDLEIKVVEQKGVCPVGHKVGDIFLFEGGLTGAGLCTTALSALLPAISVLTIGAGFPWEADQNSSRRACQDYNNTVIFEVRRILR